MGTTKPLWRLAAKEIVSGISLKQFTAREVVTAVLERVEQVNPVSGALASVQADDALRRADELDTDFAAGKPLLPLQGVPVTTKINTDQNGLPTTNGTHFFADRIASGDDPGILNMRRAGAVIIGRSNAPAMSMRWTTENDVHGRTYNPWQPDVVPGGSSGGAAVGVAVGFGPAAHGNDGGGSIRMPAFCSGVVGLRPTVGRVPSAPSDENQERSFGAGLLSVQGPIGRSASDTRMLLSAMVAPSNRDPNYIPVPFDPEANREPCKVALCYDPTGTGIDDWTRASLKLAAMRLADGGYEVTEVEPPHFNETVSLWHAIGSQARSSLGPFIEKHGDEGARLLNRRVQKWNTFEPNRFIAALDRRPALVKRWDRLFAEYPLFLFPVMMGKPFTVGFDTRDEAAVEEMFRLLAPLMPASALGYPAASVPTMVKDGLPAGVQLMAARYDEARILHAAEVVEGDFTSRTPIDPVQAG